MAKLRYIVLACVALGGVLLYLLSKASSNTAAFGEHYTLLIVLNTLLVVLLGGLVGFQVWVVAKRIRQRVFGARLTMRLIVFLSLMAVIPGTLIYGVSVQFLTRSIESWFDVRVDSALEGGINLGRSILDAQLNDLLRKAEAMALSVTEDLGPTQFSSLHRLREQSGVQEATLFSARGQVLAFSSSETNALIPQLPSASILRAVRAQRPFSATETLPGKGLALRVVVPVNVLSLSEDIRILQLIQPVSARVSRDAEEVQEVYRDYKELSFSRHGLNKLFALTLTMTLLFSLLSAIALALVLSQRFSAPLGLLAEGTRAVAKGDFSPVQPVRDRDELGQLMQSFNTMTRQLGETRIEIEDKQRQLEGSKAYLEDILAHLSSGVLALDENLVVRSANPIARQLLDGALSQAADLPLDQWETRFPSIRPFMHALVSRLSAETREWQDQVELDIDGRVRILLIRGSRLPAGFHNGFLIVFDDITHLIQVQRDAAWGEVARRLAHEIKNPLTPIQLSAERLAHKLSSKLLAEDQLVLQRSTQTIVNQVGALKSMVDEFSQYSRQPSVNLQPLDLNELVAEVLSLYENSPVFVEADLAPQAATIDGDRNQLRQVIHNLLQNAQDAVAGKREARVAITTRVEGSQVALRVTDNGDGFAPDIMARAFEPYVTTKAKGTGLGLAIVKKIVEEHHGTAEARNLPGGGACVCVQLPYRA